MIWWKQAMHREMTLGNKAGAYLAMMTCPCHVGVLLILTGGTAVGTWLGQYNQLLYGAAAVLFITGVWTMFRPGKTCPLPSVQAREQI